MIRWLKRLSAERRELRALRAEQHKRYLIVKEREVAVEESKVINRRFELEARARRELGDDYYRWKQTMGEGP